MSSPRQPQFIIYHCILIVSGFLISPLLALTLQQQTLIGSNFGVPTINRTFDYVIVGGGTAGLAVAYRLSQNPNVTVAVVEAGGFYETTNGNISQVPGYDTQWASSSPSPNAFNPLIDWGIVTTPQEVRLPSQLKPDN